MVKLWCEDWTDPDTVATWDFYRSDGMGSAALLKSSLSGLTIAVLPSGVQQLTAKVSDRLNTRTAPQRIATINVTSIDLSSRNLTEELDALNQEADPTKTLSYVSVIIHELEKNGVGFQSNMELLAVQDAVNKYIASEAVPAALKDVLRSVMENAKQNPNSLMDLVSLLASNQLNQANSNMTQQQLVDMVNGLLKKSNDAMANVVGDLVKSIGKVPIITPEDLLPVINTVNSALSYATSITLNTAPTGDKDGALQGAYNVIAGYVDASLFDLSVASAVITIHGETAYIRGDLRAAKAINGDAGDYVFVQFTAAGSSRIVDGKALFSDGTQIVFFDGQAIAFGNVTILDCLATASDSYGTTWSNVRFTVWNATWNESNDSFTAKSGRLTAWMSVESGEFLVNSVIDGDRKLCAGGVLAANSALLSFLGDTQKLTYNGGNITIDAVNNATFSLTLKGALNADVDSWLGRLADPVRIDWLDANILVPLKLDGVITVPLKATSARMVSGMIGMTLPTIKSFIQHVGAGSFLQPHMDYNETALSDDLFAGKLIVLDHGILVTKDGKSLTTLNFAAVVSLEGPAFKCRNGTNDAVIYIQNAIWKIDRSNSSGKVIIGLSGGTMDVNSQTHIFTLLEIVGGATVTIDGGRVYRNASDGYVITDARISFSGTRPDERLPTGSPFACIPQIRYIEEYTPEQWAAESTKLKQQQIAPDGTGFSVGYGKPADVFKAPLVCDDWTVVFPPLLTDLNIENTTNDMFVRVTLTCIPNNPYSFADNAHILVNSGSIDVQLKTKDGIPMNVTNATKPIEIRGTVRSVLIQPPLRVLPSELRRNEAIRLHALRVQQWNASLFVEFDMSSAYFDANIDVWLFLSFDSIPGPLEHQHMWAICVPKENAKFSWLISDAKMVNRTGLFYVGVGQRFTGNDTSSIAANDSTVVVYNNTWAFVRNFTFEYSLRAITKGCFFYDPDVMLYNSKGIKPDTIVGERIVSCKTSHLTPFAVGLFTPPNQVNFDYKFVDPHFARNMLVILGIALLTVVAIILAVGASF
uniref:Uncharacterized protein n=1 Tax=Plectus sambesii TaxID=2011161 RepID=A0A914W4Q7_9BILA